MNVKKYLRFIMLVFAVMIAAVAAFPVSFRRKDSLPTYKIEQLDERKNENHDEDEYQAYS